MAKTQWNTMNAEARQTIGEVAVLVGKLAQLKVDTAKARKGRKLMIDTDRADLAKLEKGETTGILRDKATIEKSLKDRLTEDSALEKVEKKAIKDMTKIMNDACNLVPDSMCRAFETRFDNQELYRSEIGLFLTGLGVTPTDSTIGIIEKLVGEDEARGKSVLEDFESMGLKTTKKEKYCRIIIKGIAREMIKAKFLKVAKLEEEFTAEFSNIQ